MTAIPAQPARSPRTPPRASPSEIPVVGKRRKMAITLTYSLDAQDGTNFEIDSNGQIKTQNDLDYETTPSYLVTVSVTDGLDGEGNTGDFGVRD